MMSNMRPFLVSICIGGLVLACKEPASIQPLNPPTAEEQQQAALTKKLQKNWQLDLPTFDDSNSDRLLPYSPVAVPARPRLLAADRLTYRYDSLGRLRERYANYIGTDIASTRHIYDYDQQGLQQVSYQWGSYPGTPLWVVRKVTFLTNQAGRVDRYFEQISSNGSGFPVLLRFDQSGHLIWSGQLKDPVYSTELKGYSRAIRDTKHNVVLLRSTLEKAYTAEYEYDDKPNPFYLLGGMPDFTSPNNVIKETKRNLAGNLLSVTEYSYEYRADGYPIRKRWGTEVIDYIYEN